MRVIAKSWTRDCGANEIMTADLDEGSLDPTGDASYRGGIVYVRNKSNGDVEVLTGPHSLTLGGKYQTILTETKADILGRFVEAFKGAAFFATINDLAKLAKSAKR